MPTYSMKTLIRRRNGCLVSTGNIELAKPHDSYSSCKIKIFTVIMYTYMFIVKFLMQACAERVTSQEKVEIIFGI